LKGIIFNTRIATLDKCNFNDKSWDWSSHAESDAVLAGYQRRIKTN